MQSASLAYFRKLQFSSVISLITTSSLGLSAMLLILSSEPVERSSIIEDAIFEVLNQLAEYEFTLEYYKKRVAERSGRSVSNDEESDED